MPTLLALWTLAAVPSAWAETRPLRFLGNAGLAPVVYAEGGAARGVAVDLVQAAAREAGLDLRIEAVNWQQAQADLTEGRADGLIHINPTPERLRSLAFSAPLLDSRFHLYRRHDRVDIRDLDSVPGLRVGVERSGFPAQFLAGRGHARIEYVSTWADAFARLARGELDAVFVDQWAGDFALAQSGRSDIVAVEPPLVEGPSRVAVAAHRTELLAAIDRGLQAIERNGTRQAILQRWSGQEVVYLTRQAFERKLTLAIAALAGAALLLALAHVARLRRLNRTLASARDAQARAFEASEQTNVQLRALMAEQGAIADNEVVGIVKVRGRVIVWANRALAGMFGYGVDEIVGQTTRCFFESDQAFLEFGTRMADALARQGRLRGDLRLLRKDGSAGWFSLSVARLGPDCDLQLGAIVDVTAERSASAALHDAFDDLHELYNDSPIGLHSLGPDGTVVRMNDTELKWLGRDRADVVGRMHYADLLTPPSRAVFAENFPRFCRTGVLHDLRFDLATADGRTLPVLASARAVYDDQGRYVMSRSSVLDLTQQLRAQAQMEQAQRIAQLGSFEVDLVGGRIEWSREMHRLFDVPEDEALTVESILLKVHPDDRDWVLARYRRSCGQGDPMQLRCRLVVHGGEVRHVDLSGECRRDAQGAVVGMVGMAQDVTAEVRSSEAIERSNQRFQSVVDALSELVCRVRADGTVLLVNPQFCKTFGVDAAAVVGSTWKPLAHPDDLPMIEARLRELSPLNPIVVVENRVRTATQAVRWMEFVNHGFFDEHGALVEIQAVGRDVHERRMLQERLAAELQDRQAMLDNDLVGIVTVRDRHIVWANPAFERMLGYGPGELAGLPARACYPSDAAHASFGAQAYAALARGERVALRAEYVGKDGRRVWADVHGAKLSQPGLTLWVFVDVTARKLAEDELQRHRADLEALVAERTARLSNALELAEAANRARSAFLATMSHELRTPLNAILGLTPIVRRRSSDPRAQDMLAKVEAAGQQLLALIDDVLDVTRIESHRLRIDRRPLRLADILARVDVALGPAAGAKGLALQVESPPELLTHAFVGDPLRIEQVLVNLLGNAIKFTERGSVRMRLQASPEAGHRTLLHVEVIDTGIGIRPEDQERIFSLFEQLDGSLSRQHGGSGLGLALCRGLAALMGGRIGVASQPGMGSCFWFEVPLDEAGTVGEAHAADEDTAARLRDEFGGAKVQVVEDDRVNAEVARLLLEDVSIASDWAAGGEAAIERVAAQRYALILMDLQMPGMDGLAAARAIRAMPHGKGLPILALTARVLDVDSRDCQAAGIDGVIAKPVVVADFQRRLLDALRQAAAAPAAG